MFSKPRPSEDKLNLIKLEEIPKEIPRKCQTFVNKKLQIQVKNRIYECNMRFKNQKISNT